MSMSLPSALLLLLGLGASAAAAGGFAAPAAAQAPDSGAAGSRTAGPKAPYWQQQVSYDITARLDERAGTLAGEERIRYVNRSPDTLETFALHLYLNAFRPGSRWADADSAEGRRRFNDLKDPDYGFNHVRRVRIMGQAVEPTYPFAPDSTVVRFALPRPLAPGDSLTVEMDWDARPSTVPRRQGRQGRRFDFAQWYPKVVVYDKHGWAEHPLYPAGEFYGEFAEFRVRLDVPEDQVVGSTGVALCGDPGWERANRGPAPIDYQRDWYGADVAGAADCTGAEPGYKRMVWYARDVHHFAMSLNPAYRYEGGRWGDVAVHVLYQPGDERTWGNGVAVKRTEIALGWLDSLYGKFAWPQITNVHRIEGGGTEFPMMIHDGSADQGLIVHELGHNYTMGILANNEWREGFLDEGFTSFQTDWFWEQHGRPGGYERTEAGMLQLDLEGYSEPTSLVSEAYRDFVTYNVMIYNRGALFFHQLRYIVGDDVMRRILRTYYDRWKLKHVDEAAFKAVAEEVSGRDLSTFFGQWLHAVELYDYGVGRVQRRPIGDGRWRTRVEVVRHAAGRIPVEVAVLSKTDTALVRAEGLAEREWVELVTEGKPTRVLVDPRVRTHDWNMLNNRRDFGFKWGELVGIEPGTELYVHPYFKTRSARDHYTLGFQPLAWYNDAGGLTFGGRVRGDYLGRYDQNDLWISASTGLANPGAEADAKDVDFLARVRNPRFLRAPNLSQSFEAFSFEGRYGARIAVDWSRRPHLGFGPAYSTGLSLQWVRTDDLRYLDPGRWEPAGTVELQWASGVTKSTETWDLAFRESVGGGLAYGRTGIVPPPTGDATGSELYFRGTLEATAKGSLGAGFDLGVRGFGGLVQMKDDAVRQRRIYLGGSDPYATLYNPFLRSRGALFNRNNVFYHDPGDANLRGFAPSVSGTYAVALNAELAKTLLARPRATLFRSVALALFGDVAVSDADVAVPGGLGDDANLFGDAGVGLRAEHRIGNTVFTTRVDFPLYVSRAILARDGHPDESAGFRWQFSFQPAF
ncbi:MAG TPA: M1 family metallopeptidase [Gemmatimonadales bacterium]|nr:M1 family metallopeptidase [Gemmatimonadales bacterium]